MQDADWRLIRQRRRLHNRLGFAYQMAFVRVVGRFPQQEPLEIDDDILRFIALQLSSDPADIHAYKSRRQTIADHQHMIQAHLDLRPFDAAAARDLGVFLEGAAGRLDRTSSLLAQARSWLRESQILAPAESSLRRAVGSARQAARTAMATRLMDTLPASRQQDLDQLLHRKDDTAFSPLSDIKLNPSEPSIAAMHRLLGHLKRIETTRVLEIDIGWINPNYQRVLFHSVRTTHAARLREMPAPQRYLALVCYLRQMWRETLDQGVDMYGKLLRRYQRQAHEQLDARLTAQRRTIDRVVDRYRRLGAVLLDPAIDSDDLRAMCLAAVPEEDLRDDQDELAGWVSGGRRSRFLATVDKHASLARFAAPFLTRMVFLDETRTAGSPTLEALRFWQTHPETARKSTLPDTAPLEFVPRTLKPVICPDGVIDRPRWESALFYRVHDEIRAGNLAVAGAKNFGQFADFFLPDAQWQAVRPAFWRQTGLPAEPAPAVDVLKTRLSAAFDQFLAGAADNRQVVFDDRGWRLKRDQAERLEPRRAQQLAEMKRWLKARTRTLRLADLLIEVENDLRFTAHFRQSTDSPAKPDGICARVAAILAYGCNLGLTTMEQITTGIPSGLLRQVGHLHLHDENQRAALASIVHGISRLDAVTHWGDGTTSASDGQRFAMRSKVLQRTYSTRFNDFALEFYSFIADNYAPFFSHPTECTDRDAPFVIDGIHYHESDLDLAEHYTDTHGYTEINFAAFAMASLRFCPRIKNLHRQNIYCADPARDHGPLEPVLKRGRRAIDFRLIAEQWDPMGQFHAAFPQGHATASAALQRLNRFHASNRFYAANRELGRVLKTEFLLHYMSEPQLRARVRRGLLKVEELHALARAVYYGQRGRITVRDVYDQMKTCSCLTLILACIIYWQARELSRLSADPDFPFDRTLLQHVSPIQWHNIILYGEIRINPDKLWINAT